MQGDIDLGLKPKTSTSNMSETKRVTVPDVLVLASIAPDRWYFVDTTFVDDDNDDVDDDTNPNTYEFRVTVNGFDGTGPNDRAELRAVNSTGYPIGKGYPATFEDGVATVNIRDTTLSGLTNFKLVIPENDDIIVQSDARNADIDTTDGSGLSHQSVHGKMESFC